LSKHTKTWIYTKWPQTIPSGHEYTYILNGLICTYIPNGHKNY
jgi:hypothetical protein